MIIEIMIIVFIVTLFIFLMVYLCIETVQTNNRITKIRKNDRDSKTIKVFKKNKDKAYLK